MFTDSIAMSAVRRSVGGSISVPSGTEAEDTGDELLESAFRSAATVAPRQRGERKRSQYRHRKSCKYIHNTTECLDLLYLLSRAI